MGGLFCIRHVATICAFILNCFLTRTGFRFVMKMLCKGDRDVTPEVMTPLETDVLVIGAGGAGMYAALEAARAGANVILADRSLIGNPSGNSTGVSG